jgi:hypothetical protein
MAKATQRDDGMNGTERDYAAHLEAERRAGRIKRWDREPEALRLADRTTYWPDFRVVAADDAVEFHEVKPAKGKTGTFFAHEDAWLKLKIVAGMHPYRFVVAWPASKRDGRVTEWHRKAI